MKKNKGSVVIYIVLLIFVLMTSAAIVLSTILSKHIRASENYLSSEQAFAAANSGVENMLYQISKSGASAGITVNDSVVYGTGASGFSVLYKGDGCTTTEAGLPVPHISVSGTYKGLVRRIELGGGASGC